MKAFAIVSIVAAISGFGSVGAALAQDAPRLGEAPALQIVGTPPPATSAAYGSRSGTLLYKITITVKSLIPSTQKIYCIASANAYGMQSNNEQVSKAATRSGSTATCTLSIPYAWVGVDGTSGMITSSITIYTGSTETTGRYANRTLEPISPLPANGTTKTVNVAMTL